MKKVVLCSILLFGSFTFAFAQSGRKVSNPIPGTNSSDKKPLPSEVEPTEKISKENIGYSESSPNQPVSIRLSKQNREKNKKDKKSKNETAPKAETPTQTNSEEEEVLKVETNLIRIPVSAATRDGAYVPSLSKTSFQIFENGAEQEIAYFGSFDQPFTAILLLDVSGSTSLKIEQIQEGAIAFVRNMLPQDKAMVISFDSGIHTMLEYSNDKSALEAAIRKIKFGGGTSIYDAVNYTIRKKIEKIPGKKAIVLFTDGVDTSSTSSYESSVNEAVEADAAIFPIYLNTFLDSIGIGGGGVMSTPPILGVPGTMGGGQTVGETKAQYALGRRYIQDLASATGGRIYRADNSTVGLVSAFQGIAEELRSQYEIGYYPTDAGNPGDRKQIRVRINRPNLIVRSRDSYIVQ